MNTTIMYRCLTLLLATMTFSRASAAGDTTKVLFIGNSFTYVFDVPQLTHDLALATGHPFKFAMHAPGGITVGDIDQGTDAHMNNPIVFDLIRSDDWDYVVLQDNQGRFVRSYGVFPATTTSKVIEGHIKIRDSVAFYHPCARMIWFAGWAWKDGYPGIATTGDELIRNIHDNYQYLRDTAGEIIAPIGIAWQRAKSQIPSVDLWGPDATHQSLAGSYLTASVIFSTIFRSRSEGAGFNGGLDSAVARTYRTIGYQVVADSLQQTNLTSYTPQLSVNGNMLVSDPGYANYSWYRNGVLLAATSTNTFNTTINGCYQVLTTTTSATGSCKAYSVELCQYPTAISALETPPSILLYPNPATDYITFETSLNEPGDITIIDATGRKVLTSSAPLPPRIPVLIKTLPAGTYFLQVVTRAHSYRACFIKNNLP